MSNPYRMLPPLGALVGFEAAARLSSFSQAAAELNMTQSAISHQIRTLEKHLEQPLFKRLNRRVELTDAGIDLHRTAEEALEKIRQGVQRLGAFSKPGSVILHMSPTLASQWFLPRLPAFRAAHPDVDPWLFSHETEPDLAEAEVNITISKNPVLGEGLVRHLLFHEECVPVAAPEVAARYAKAFEHAPLLHDESTQDWQKWFDRAGIQRGETLAGPNFSDSAQMLQAAAQGLGVCLGSRVLAQSLIAEGKLVVMSDIALAVDAPTYLVTLEGSVKRPSVRALWDWLKAQGEGVAASSGKKQAD